MSKLGSRLFSPLSLAIPSISSSTSVSFLRKHSCFHSAKYEGDIDAAYILSQNILKETVVSDIMQKCNHSPLIIPVIDQEGSSTNVIPIAYGHYLASKTGGTLVRGITKSTRQSNTDSNMLGRIQNDILFDGEYDFSGKEVILVDDTWTVGGTIMALADHVIKLGANVCAITTLSSGRYGKSIAHLNKQYLRLSEILQLTEAEFLVKYEHAINQCTGSELQAAILSGNGARRILEYANKTRN